jgi:hypothetical protein
MICITSTLLAATLASGLLYAGTPVLITNNLRGTVGVAASTSQLLFTQPFCATQGVTRGVYSVNTTTGVASLYSAIPETGVCTENYLALSTGSGGFTAGAAYVTDGGTIYVVPPGGGVATALTITGDALSGPGGHSGIGFDTVGTFGNRLIFTSSDGVWAITAAGVSTKLSGGLGSNVFLESPAVAPTSGFGAFNGFLFMTAEDDNQNGGTGPKSGIYYIAPNTNPLQPVKFVGKEGSAPEAIQFVPQNTCSLTIANQSYMGFSSDYSQNSVGQTTSTDSAIYGYATSDFAGLAGKAIVTFEYADGTGYNVGPGDLQVFDATGAASQFANLQKQLEGFNLITCNVPLPPTNCPLTIGFWKNHTSAWKQSIFPVTIGGIQYSAAQFLTVLNTPSGQGQGADAKIILGKQLIGAILNVANGAPPTPLIAQASALLNGINLLTGAVVPPSSALGQQMVALGDQLNTYNSNENCHQ